jgi:hypothetical protein
MKQTKRTIKSIKLLLTEDAADYNDISKRKNEPLISFAKVLKHLSLKK